MNNKLEIFQRATDWLKGRKDFATGLAVLQESGFKPAVVNKLRRDGENGPEAAERLEYQMREFVKAYGVTVDVPDTDPELHIFDGQEAPADHDETQQLGIMDTAEKMEAGELLLEKEEPREVIHEYAAAYRQREKAIRELAEAGEENDEESMARRKALSDMIEEKTALMERLYPLFEKYQSGEDISVEEVENAINDNPDSSTEKSSATESGATHTSEDDDLHEGTVNLEGKSREELVKLKKNAGVRLLRTQNKLEYQSDKKGVAPNPMPEGPERVKLEARAENIKKEIEAIDMPSSDNALLHTPDRVRTARTCTNADSGQGLRQRFR